MVLSLILTFDSIIYILSYVIKELLYHLAALRVDCSVSVRCWHWDPVLGLDIFLKRVQDMHSV